MKNLKLTDLIVAGLVALVVAAGYVYFQSPQKASPPLGATPGSTFTGPVVSFNGLNQWDYSQNIVQTSTTTCSFLTPAATTTMTFGSINISTGTSTGATIWEIGKSTVGDATTTQIGTTFTLPTSALATVVASSTNAAAGGTTLIFGPSQFLNFKFGPYSGTTIGDSGFRGSCKARFIQN